MSRLRRQVRVGATLGLLAALTLSVSGCQDDEPSPDDRADDPPASATPTRAPSGTADPTPAAAPATGDELELTSLTLHMPKGWEQIDETGRSVSAADLDPEAGGPLLYVSDAKNLGTGDLDAGAADELFGFKGERPAPKQRENRVVDGVEGWVVAGSTSDFPVVYEYGTVQDGNRVVISLQYRTKPQDVQDEIESVLASVKWK